MIDAVTIRPARAVDAREIAILATALGYPTTPEELPARLASIADDPHHHVLVAEFQAAVIGWIHVYAKRTLAREGDAEIAGLIVDDGHRGQGVGKRLVDAAIASAKEIGCHSLVVRSNVVRENTARFYSDRGFETIKTQSVFRRSLDST